MERIIIYGAGAVGGVIGASLYEHGIDVVLIARGEHLRVMQRDGLAFLSPGRSTTLKVPAVANPKEIDFREGDAVLLAMKSQDTEAALHELQMCAPPSTPIVCVQNGVENERRALRLFENVYGVIVICPATHLSPGTVVAHSSEPYGAFDIGRYPSGVDVGAEELAGLFNTGGLASTARGDIMAWKHGKLLDNVGNAVEVVCGFGPSAEEVIIRAREEGAACLSNASIPFHSYKLIDERRRAVLRRGEVIGYERSGSSTWQSLARGAGGVESDFLSGEIVLIGRMNGFPTPVNELLQRLTAEVAHGKRAAGELDAASFFTLLEPPGGAL